MANGPFQRLRPKQVKETNPNPLYTDIYYINSLWDSGNRAQHNQQEAIYLASMSDQRFCALGIYVEVLREGQLASGVQPFYSSKDTVYSDMKLNMINNDLLRGTNQRALDKYSFNCSCSFCSAMKLIRVGVTTARQARPQRLKIFWEATVFGSLAS